MRRGRPRRRSTRCPRRKPRASTSSKRRPVRARPKRRCAHFSAGSGGRAWSTAFISPCRQRAAGGTIATGGSVGCSEPFTGRRDRRSCSPCPAIWHRPRKGGTAPAATIDSPYGCSSRNAEARSLEAWPARHAGSFPLPRRLPSERSTRSCSGAPDVRASHLSRRGGAALAAGGRRGACQRSLHDGTARRSAGSPCRRRRARAAPVGDARGRCPSQAAAPAAAGRPRAMRRRSARGAGASEKAAWDRGATAGGAVVRRSGGAPGLAGSGDAARSRGSPWAIVRAPARTGGRRPEGRRCLTPHPGGACRRRRGDGPQEGPAPRHLVLKRHADTGGGTGRAADS